MPCWGSRVSLDQRPDCTTCLLCRARAQKRAADKGVSAKEKDGLTAQQRRDRDAKALQEKLAKKAAEQGKATKS